MIKKIFNTVIRPAIRLLGIDLVRHEVSSEEPNYLSDFSKENLLIYEAVKQFTMTSPERVNALIEAIKYVVRNKIGGALVECGVWRGGSVMAMALALKQLDDESRDIYLYDTFTGMVAPTDVDKSRIYGDDHAKEQFSKLKISEDSSHWLSSSLEEVKENVLSTGYPKKKLHFIKGKVEDTIPENIPREIALLRHDTDFYVSTKHELIHLFPLVKPKGVIIFDDYAHWEGARKAVDEYIEENHICIFLNRIDSQGRIGIKTA
jgi:O-methyltransferase